MSTPFKRDGWYPEMRAAMKAMGPEVAEPMKQSPMYEDYKQVAPKVEDWPILVTQLTGLLKLDYDWSADVAGLSMPVMIVVGDADGLPPSHAVEFFGLLGGGQRDANWDRSGMTQHRLAILPGVTHYDINVVPALAEAVIPFLDGASPASGDLMADVASGPARSSSDTANPQASSRRLRRTRVCSLPGPGRPPPMSLGPLACRPGRDARRRCAGPVLGGRMGGQSRDRPVPGRAPGRP